jgi:phosphohistidine phosphatase SixA
MNLNPSLSSEGRSDILRLANYLAEHQAGRVVAVLSSPAKRSMQSAGIIGLKFGVRPKSYSILFSKSEADVNVPEVIKLIQPNIEKSEVVIIVTHYEYVQPLGEYLIEKNNILWRWPNYGSIKEGGALIIDCTTGETSVYSPEN